MKHFKKVLFVVLIIAGLNNINAQDSDNPWSIDIGTNVVDFYPTGASDSDVAAFIKNKYGFDAYMPVGGFFEDFFNGSDHWNTASVISRLRVGRYLGAGFSLGLAGSFNKIDKVGDNNKNNGFSEEFTYFGADLDVRWSPLNHLWFDPYLMVGGGFSWLDGDGSGTVNGGLGINFWFNDFIGANVQTMYKYGFDAESMLPHFQHALGLIFKFGGKDTDGDGIYDKYDACPEVAGLEKFNGCPDTDGDGIQDSEDACPNTPGLAEFNGCPDTDGDGIPDKDDACPTEAGLASLNGCPDRDGDGVADKDDQCPDVAGPAENNGCPWPDSDGDGILDKDDECPNIPGVAENNGCPMVTQAVQQELLDLARAIFFNVNKFTFTEETKVRLHKISQILDQYKSINFTVEGHTDDTGSAAYNQKLSERRANAVRDYLIDNGFPADKITAIGYGEERPICKSHSRKCRQANRRVDIFSEKANRDLYNREDIK